MGPDAAQDAHVELRELGEHDEQRPRRPRRPVPELDARRALPAQPVHHCGAHARRCATSAAAEPRLPVRHRAIDHLRVGRRWLCCGCELQRRRLRPESHATWAGGRRGARRGAVRAQAAQQVVLREADGSVPQIEQEPLDEQLRPLAALGPFAQVVLATRHVDEQLAGRSGRRPALGAVAVWRRRSEAAFAALHFQVAHDDADGDGGAAGRTAALARGAQLLVHPREARQPVQAALPVSEPERRRRTRRLPLADGDRPPTAP